MSDIAKGREITACSLASFNVCFSVMHYDTESFSFFRGFDLKMEKQILTQARRGRIKRDFLRIGLVSLLSNETFITSRKQIGSKKGVSFLHTLFLLLSIL